MGPLGKDLSARDIKLKKLSFLSIHPDFIKNYLSFGPLASAIEKQKLKCDAINLRDFAIDKHGTVDGRPFGGGDGMVLRPEPISAAIESSDQPFVVLSSPRGKPWKQDMIYEFLTMRKHIYFICGRFSGVDQRIIDRYVDQEVSCGDFVLSGGELPSLMIADTLVRMIPGVLGHQDSALYDSFSDAYNGLLEQDLYTRPSDFKGQKVPDVLLSGNHQNIEKWQAQQRLLCSKKYRSDLL